MYSIQRRRERTGLLDPVGGDGQPPGRSPAPLKAAFPRRPGWRQLPRGESGESEGGTSAQVPPSFPFRSARQRDAPTATAQERPCRTKTEGGTSAQVPPSLGFRSRQPGG
ncbi:hypothetical protein Scani_60520 [Streptomyces caniferus]|uniref:Uncharacterized protein n=1 Tax=Streptomyces caniferus TaxID=285557 RepID=A0A640SG12_9ACTN|nr:hypothetical protein Scani_60520 [Streptomyces caniferus]